jgi:hypothetical protein
MLQLQNQFTEFGVKMLIEMPKQEISAMAQVMVHQSKENGDDTLSQLALSSKFKHFFTEVESQLNKASIEDLRKYDGSKLSKHGVDFSITETGIKYDYTQTQKWVDLQKQIDELIEKQKQVEKFCKALKPGQSLTEVDPETGEAHVFVSPSKSSTESIRKTIK